MTPTIHIMSFINAVVYVRISKSSEYDQDPVDFTLNFKCS